MIKELTIENKSLPIGWEIKPLGEVCEIQLGKTPQRKTEKFWDKENSTNNVWLSIADMVHGDKLSESKEHISDLGAANIKISPKGTLLVSFKLTLGRVSFAEKDLYTNEAIASLINLDNEIDKKYLFYYFTFFDWQKEAEGDVKLMGKTLNKAKLKALNLIVPPLIQQKQIVATLDKAFAAIDTAKANAEQNLQNAKELFESYLQNVFENKSDDWEEKTLGEVVNFFNGFAFKSMDAVDDSNTQVIRMGNLYQNKLNLGRKPAFYPDAFKTEFSKYLLLKDDLIISLTGTTGKEDYGYTVKIPRTERNLLLNQRIAKFIIKDENVINRNFLFRFLLSRTFLDELYKTANGTRQANLSTNTMKNLFISFPNVSGQEKIVQKLDILSKETRKLESIYTQKIADLEEMKKSVLQKAFSGQLSEL
jgi:type I restriction enzyme S subunit